MFRAPHRHPSVQEKLEWFDFEHLPHGRGRAASGVINDAAFHILEVVTKDHPQLTIGLQHLIEAKDCFVRAALAEQRAEDQGGN